MTETDLMKRTVTADIDLDVTGPGRVVFQVAVVQAPGLEVDENLVLTLDGKPMSAREVVGVTGSRFHLVEPQPGKLLLSYTATVTGRADPPEVLEHELIEYLRPSRYAESDKLAGVAAHEFGGITAPDELLAVPGLQAVAVETEEHAPIPTALRCKTRSHRSSCSSS